MKYSPGPPIGRICRYSAKSRGHLAAAAAVGREEGHTFDLDLSTGITRSDNIARRVVSPSASSESARSAALAPASRAFANWHRLTPSANTSPVTSAAAPYAIGDRVETFIRYPRV